MEYQPNSWSCLPTAWSYVVHWPLWSLVKAIGHDGSDIVWPNNPEPYCRRGFHPQELIYLGDRFGFVTTTFEPLPQLKSLDQPQIQVHDMPFSKILASGDGVLTGQCDGAEHAVAWINNEVFDPAQGRLKDLETFHIRNFHRIKSKWWY